MTDEELLEAVKEAKASGNFLDPASIKHFKYKLDPIMEGVLDESLIQKTRNTAAAAAAAAEQQQQPQVEKKNQQKIKHLFD